jgi:hypothetical protein
MLRITILAIGTFILFQALAAGPVGANDGPWCAIRNFGSDASEDCQFRTFEECRETIIAGIRGFCNQNPRWQGPADVRATRKRGGRPY